jgi:hypothetical protein
MPFAGVTRAVKDLFDSPASEIDAAATRDDAERAAAEAPDTSVSDQLAKRLFSAVDSGRGGKSGTQAHIDIYRSVVQQRGGKEVPRSERVTQNGTPLQEYRFIITNTSFKNAERFSVRSTFGDAPEIAHSFGEKPKIWGFNGILRSGTGETQWRKAMEMFYRQRLRPTKMMRNNEFVRFRIGDLSLRGYILNFSTTQSEKMDPAMARFQFSMYVRSFDIESASFRFTPASRELAADVPPAPEEGAEQVEIAGLQGT